jgi:quinoprotein glucose dehydrogenase
MFHTGDIPKNYGSELTPLKVGNAIYGCTPMNKLFALNAATGEKLWIYDPEAPTSWVPYTAACGGLAYYENPNATVGEACAARIIEGTLDMRLIAVDAKSGQPRQDFGKNGSAELKVGLGRRIALRAPLRPSCQGRLPSPLHRSLCTGSSSPGTPYSLGTPNMWTTASVTKGSASSTACTLALSP